MNASTADDLPPLPPDFSANDGWGAWIGQASDTAFDAYVAAARLVRLPDPTRAYRRVTWPASQPPFAVPDLDRRDQPTVTFACDPEARPLAPFALIGHFREPAGTAPDLPESPPRRATTSRPGPSTSSARVSASAYDPDGPRHDGSSHAAPSATPSSPDPRSPPSSPSCAAGSAIPRTDTTPIPMRISAARAA